MPNVNDFFPSKHLRASDLNGQPRVVTIECDERVKFDNGEQKPVAKLRGEKSFVLNKTNFNAIAKVPRPRQQRHLGWVQDHHLPDSGGPARRGRGGHPGEAGTWSRSH
jgi:hypothetical protein